ncbi:zinc finger CCCH domain-containing protein 15-like [Cornus florida]|uniref:zinc finger CCCH domain-containing protein 15-like n=1 Tax=Cornus florida TaxID=4283 RepID=UPI0028A2705C|nr:zinc finger CCCH domain-containing protein 15-like [Cornus florida]
MQKEISQSNVDNDNNNSKSNNSSPQYLSQNPLLSPSQNQTIDFFPSFSPSNFSDDDGVALATEIENRLYRPSVMLEYQQLYNRNAMCLAHLQESMKEVDALRLENDELRLANTALVRRLSLFSQATIQNCMLSSGHPPRSFFNDFHRLDMGGIDSRVAGEVSDVSPTSVIEHNRGERRSAERVSLPKSISVRSSGYLKMNQRGRESVGPSRGATSHRRVPSPVPNESQRMYVPRGKKEEEALEFEVYNQGMQKTELCNKWQETGACRYGDQCQFAHGIKELRPVIRHPRYKTEVCRMVLVGGSCPYGHRCHFRHTLTEQEKLLGHF